jgi:hypothetical protein
LSYIHNVECEVVFTDEFGEWWNGLSESEQDSIDRVVRILVAYGAALRFPYSSRVESSAFAQMRELRVQHQGRPYRVLYGFDPRRQAVLLLGGDKTGQDRWYEIYVPIADRIFNNYLNDMEKGEKE